MRRRNLPIFVPHVGCPHRCSFCDQRAISGAVNAPTPDDVKTLCREAVTGLGAAAASCEIAFFGGSFTAIDSDYRRSLLGAAAPFVGQGGFMGIRLSTRPDCIDEAILRELASFGVTAIELGAQSMDDDVLRQNGRGHTACDTRRAARLIREAGIELGLQMMTGLVGDRPAGAVRTAEAIIALRPDTVRIYPTLVLRGTELAQLYEAGGYEPMALDAAVDLCAELIARFERADIAIIKLGLHAGENLGSEVVAGPYHPAFRQLCEGKLMLERLLGQIDTPKDCSLDVVLHPADVSNMVGHARCNTLYLSSMGVTMRLQPNIDAQRLWPRVLDHHNKFYIKEGPTCS